MWGQLQSFYTICNFSFQDFPKAKNQLPRVMRLAHCARKRLER